MITIAGTRFWLLIGGLLSFSALAELPAPGQPGAPADPRYCGEPERDANGKIKRSGAVLRDFVEVFPCPATLLKVTSCNKWQLNHQLPLASGGCDSVANLIWLPVKIKTCAEPWCVDRWERIYHAIPRRAVILP